MMMMQKEEEENESNGFKILKCMKRVHVKGVRG